MTRCIITLVILLIALYVTPSSYSQKCPPVAVTCPQVTKDSNATFSARVHAGEPATYKWTVSGGRIALGQGTASINVTVERHAQMITATVEIVSFPKDCPRTASCSIVIHSGYPSHWWEPVHDPKKPDWEILPQEAKPGEVILSKRNELGLLSNFAATPFIFHGKRYASLEGFWQSMLYPEGPTDARAKFPGLHWQYTREQVSNMTAFEAKRAGELAEQKMRTMKIGWVSFEGKHFAYRPKKAGRHSRLIVAATRAKVLQNPEVKKVLLTTGDLILRPDHHQEPNAPAAWRYFEILMNIRRDVQKPGN